MLIKTSKMYKPNGGFVFHGFIVTACVETMDSLTLHRVHRSNKEITRNPLRVYRCLQYIYSVNVPNG